MNNDQEQREPKPDQEAQTSADRDVTPQNRSKLSTAGGALIGIGTLIAAFLALIGTPGPKFVSMGLLILAAAAVPVFWCAGLGESRRFHIGVAAVLALVLTGAGFYVGLGPVGSGSRPVTVPAITIRHPTLPHFVFTGPSQATVPWCSNFSLTGTAAIPVGYKLVIFAAGADVNWQVESSYSWLNVATPVPGRHNEWATRLIYFGPKDKPHPQSKPVVYAGYHGIVVAELLTDQMSNFLAGISVPTTQSGVADWGLKRLPFSTSVATQDVIRNSDTSSC